jgi:translation initiation factor IF-3
MDYNRFKYETAQKAKESRKKATNTSIKEMKYRPKIGTGDFLTKTRQVSRFLEDGHKVKVTIMFRGREVSHPELGMKILEDLAEQVSAVAKVEAAPKLDGRNMTMVLAPDRRAKPVTARKPGSPEGGPPETTGAGPDPGESYAEVGHQVPDDAATPVAAAPVAEPAPSRGDVAVPVAVPPVAASQAPTRAAAVPSTAAATAVGAAPL